MVRAAPTINASTTNTASWIRMCLVITSRPLIPAVWNGQRVAGGVGAGELSDGASPLQLQFGEVALPARAGENSLVDPAEGEVEDGCEVGVVAADPVLHRLVGPGICRQQTQ